MGSARQGRNQVVRAEGSATAQTGAVSELTVTYDAIASTGGITRTLLLWDFVAGDWVEIDQISNEGTSEDPPDLIPVSNPSNFVSDTGEVRFRVETTARGGHELWLDQLNATVTTTE